MAWCHQATNHYLSQCWPSSLSPYGVTRPQCVNVNTRRAHKFLWTRGDNRYITDTQFWQNKYSCEHCNFTTTDLIHTISRCMGPSWAIDVTCHCHWPAGPCENSCLALQTPKIFGRCNSKTAGLIRAISSSKNPCRSLYVQRLGHQPVGPLHEFMADTQILADTVIPQTLDRFVPS